MEKFEFKTVNGKVKISRTKDKATIIEERTCFGFNEKSITEIKKVSDDCMHFVFGTEKSIRETLKNN